jgi:hypothetical protein
VVAVDPGQIAGAGPIANGLQAVMRAVEICHHTHAHLRLQKADLVLRPAAQRRVVLRTSVMSSSVPRSPSGPSEPTV